MIYRVEMRERSMYTTIHKEDKMNDITNIICIIIVWVLIICIVAKTKIIKKNGY